MGAGNTKLSKEEINELIKKTNYTKDQIDKLSKDYHEYSSKDKKPGFSESEFIDFFFCRFRDWDKDLLKQLFKLFDCDGNGTLDFKEFVTSLYIMTKAPVVEKLSLLFDLFDKDQSGHLEIEEVEKLIGVAVACGTSLGMDYSSVTNYVFSICSAENMSNKKKGMNKEEFIKAASNSDKFCKMICFYDSVGQMLY
ncbi:hypothetical protein ACTA71_010056 [Dictyostelium dimigraforme]